MSRSLSWLVPACTALLTLGLLGAGITREVPMGVVEGKLTMTENGRPIPKAAVYLWPKGEGVPEGAEPRRVVTDKEGRFRARVVSGEYGIEFSAKAHEAEGQTLTVAEGKVQKLEIGMAPMPPSLDLYAPQRVFTPGEKTKMEAHGFEPSKELAVKIYRLDPQKVVAQGSSLYDLLRQVARHAKGTEGNAEALSSEVKDLAVPIEARDAEGTFVQEIKLPELKEGLYWVHCQLGKLQQGQYLNVSRIGLVTKFANGKVTSFAAALRDGVPISNARIQVYQQGSPVSETKSDAQGLANFDAPPGSIVLASSGDSRAIVDLSGGQAAKDGLRLFGYSERPIYRPGDEVHFKALLRQWSGRQYKLPASQAFQVEVLDPDNEPISRQQLATNAFGSLHGSARLSPEALPGYYSVKLKSGAFEDQFGFEVAAYRKPEFTVKVSSEKPYWLLGDRVRMKVKADYYFGGPVVGAKVQAYITRTPLYEVSEEEERYAGYDDESGGYGEFIGEVAAVTDANGEAWVEFATEPGTGPKGDYRFEVEASLGDEGNQFFSGNGSAKVYQGEVRLSAEPATYVAKANSTSRFEIQAIAATPDQKLEGLPLQIRYGAETYEGMESKFKEIGVLSATLDGKGKATVEVPVGSEGTVGIRVAARDRGGRKVEAEAQVWVSGGDYAPMGMAKLEAKLDKKRYQEGETARLLIQSAKGPGSALVTVESDDILFRKVVDLSSGSVQVDLPVTENCFPNATVSVSRISEKQLVQASQEIVVEYGARELDIQVKPDRDLAQPGENVTYQVTTKNEKGEPVSADVSLAVVDESVYAIRRDDTDILEGFYPRRWSTVNTAYSFAEIYLDGGDKGGDVPVRSDFRDTAAWVPSVQTDAAGNATVTISLPDNLTSWRATAIGASSETLVGMGTSSVVSRKPLMVRLQGPKVMVEGDQMEVTATVQGDYEGQVTLQLEASGATFSGEPKADIRLSGEPESRKWTVTAAKEGAAKVIAKAWTSGGPNDGVELPIRVVPDAVYGERNVTEAVQGASTLKPSALPEGAEVLESSLTLTPSLASGMLQSLDELIAFPYGCVEQTMSRFLPTLLLSQVLEGVDFPQKAMVPAMVGDGLTRLRAMQHPDGGWGWWEYDESDPFLTAFVLDGLDRAAKAGYKVPDNNLARAWSWADSLASNGEAKVELRDRLYLAWVLARQGKAETARKLLANADPKRAKDAEYALAALAMSALGDSARSQLFLARLKSTAQVSPNTASWPDMDSLGYGQEPTAYALLALGQLAPEDPLVPKAIAHLMAARKGSGWTSTRDTCFALVALSSVVRTQEGTLTEKQVQVNGSPAETLGVLSPANRRTVPGGPVELNVAGGKVYASLQTGYLLRDTSSARPSQGIQVSRAVYALSPQKTQDGQLRMLPGKSPADSAKPGDLLRCTITLKLEKPVQFLLIEDMVPANLRIREQDTPNWQEDWSYWWDRITIRDDRIAFFKRALEKGSHTFSYVVQAEAPGKAKALPTRAGNMYSGDDMATGAASVFEVRP